VWNNSLMTSCLFFSLAQRFLRTSSSTPLDQSGGSGSASRSLSDSVVLLLAVGVTVPASCVRTAVIVSKELLGLSRLLMDRLELDELPEFVWYERPWVSKSASFVFDKFGSLVFRLSRNCRF